MKELKGVSFGISSSIFLSDLGSHLKLCQSLMMKLLVKMIVKIVDDELMMSFRNG